MNRYLLDTDVCIEMIRGRGQTIVSRLTRLEPGQCSLSAITIAELVYGAHKSSHVERNLIALLKFRAPFEVRPFDDTSAMAYGEIRAQLERAGSMIGAMDLLIAAQGLADDATVVTNNLKDFERVPGLRVERWN